MLLGQISITRPKPKMLNLTANLLKTLLKYQCFVSLQKQYSVEYNSTGNAYQFVCYSHLEDHMLKIFCC